MDIQNWTDHRLRKLAEDYLATAHPDGTLPIPIDDIVDLYERIDIVPVENLREDGHEAYTSRDRKTIYIAKGVYTARNPYRFRFTIAHELAHIKLHGNVFESADYEDIDGLRAFLAEMNEGDLRVMERQAYTLAGFLLVPSADLSNAYTTMAAELESNGVSIKDLSPPSLKHVAKKIGEVFAVSYRVIHRRAVKEGLWQWEDLPDG